MLVCFIMEHCTCICAYLSRTGVKRHRWRTKKFVWVLRYKYHNYFHCNSTVVRHATVLVPVYLYCCTLSLVHSSLLSFFALAALLLRYYLRYVCWCFQYCVHVLFLFFHCFLRTYLTTMTNTKNTVGNQKIWEVRSVGASGTSHFYCTNSYSIF